MVRGWVLFSTLVLGVLFRIYTPFQGSNTFLFSSRVLDRNTWVYYTMEHLIASGVALCLLIKDSTPVFLLKLFFVIIVLDLIHYELFFRDEGIGWNLIKCALFGLPLFYLETKRNWTHLKKYINQE